MMFEDRLNTVVTLIGRAEKFSRDPTDERLLNLAVQHTLKVKDEFDVTPYEMDMVKYIAKPLISFLRHSHRPLVEAALKTFLVVCTRHFDIPKDMMFAALFNIAYILSKPLYLGRVQELALTVLSHAPVNRKLVQDMIYESTCLHQLLDLFSKLDFQCASNDYLHSLTNALNAALILPRNAHNQKEAGFIIISKVINMLSHWINSTKLAVSMHCIQEILFLCQNVVQKIATNQLHFLQLNGVHLLAQVLKEKELSSLTKPIDVGVHKYYRPRVNEAKCLLTNIIWLLDAVVTHNKPACLKAKQCGIVEILLKSIVLDIPKSCQAGVVSVVMHITEGTHTNIPVSMLHTIHDISLKLEQKLSRGVRETIKYIMIRLQDLSTMSVKHCTKIKLTHPSTRAHCIVRRNELAALHIGVLKHGMNFKAIRSEYPYHTYLNSGTLYLLWRKMWRL